MLKRLYPGLTLPREQFVEALRGGSAWGTITSISSELQDGSLDPIAAAGQLSKLIHKVALRILVKLTMGQSPSYQAIAFPISGLSPVRKSTSVCGKLCREKTVMQLINTLKSSLGGSSAIGSATMTRLRKSICLMA
jgi:hypothetical protein